MPKVGKTEFPYTKAGMQKAKAWAEMTGEKMQMGKGYKRGGRIDPSSVQEIAHKPIESGTRQAVRYKAKTRGGEGRHIVKDIEGLTNEANKRALSSLMLMEAIRNNPDFADTVSAKEATEFMRRKEPSLWDLLKGVLPQYAEGGEVPDSRRLYGTNSRRKKKKAVMQTSTAGMPVRGETYKKGGKVKMPKGWHT